MVRILRAELGRLNAEGLRPNRHMVEVDDNLLAHARLLAAIQRSANAACEDGARIEVAECLRSRCRRFASLTERRVHAAAGAPADRVIARLVFHRAPLAIAAHLRPDKARELFVQGFPVQAELHERFVAEAVHEHVGLGEQVHHDGHALFGLQIQGNPVLVRIHVFIRRVAALGVPATETPALGTLRVTLRVFNLDDLCTEFAQHAHTGGSRNPVSQLDDLHAG